MKRVVGGRGSRARPNKMNRAKRTTNSPPAFMTVGAAAAATWLRERRLRASKSWFVELALDTSDRPASITFSHDTDNRFHLNLYPDEWGVFFCHGSRASWIRVTDEPFVHGRDDHQLLGQLPELHQIGYLLHALEDRYGLQFRREHALVRTALAGGDKQIRSWLESL
jgi:hypothetical protein